ncbi:MAG: hypothetical protein ACI86S_000703 [Paracoccaceae bacterium]|jgi:hypothetical protein
MALPFQSDFMKAFIVISTPFLYRFRLTIGRTSEGMYSNEQIIEMIDNNGTGISADLSTHVISVGALFRS